MNQAEDVEMVLGHKRRYRFHSGTLARNSALLADMLTEAKAARLSPIAKKAGITIRWMIELTRLPDDEYPGGLLEPVRLKPSGERADGLNGLIVNENGRIPHAHKAFAQYEAIFYAFYGKDLPIEDSDMSAALYDCFDLIEIADYLGCTRMISKPIEVALLKQGQYLFRAIRENPSAWIKISYRIRSEAMFRECLIHLVGNWKTFKTEQKATEHLRRIPGLLDTIENYHLEMLAKCKHLELAIISLYPGDMKTPESEVPIKREVYAKDILLWMALMFFRQWFVQRLLNEKGRYSLDCGYELYQQISTGGDAYMDKSVLHKFHAIFPITKKALYVLENHLIEIKYYMKELVQEHKILKSNCQLDTHRFPVNYLTCTNFRCSDYPWKIEDENTRALSAQPEYKPGGNDITRENHKHTRMRQKRSFNMHDMKEEGEDMPESDGEIVPLGKRARWA